MQLATSAACVFSCSIDAARTSISWRRSSILSRSRPSLNMSRSAGMSPWPTILFQFLSRPEGEGVSVGGFFTDLDGDRMRVGGMLPRAAVVHIA